jgi:hypothetical protein
MSGGGKDALADWTTGAEAIVYQSCAACNISVAASVAHAARPIR